MTAGAPVPLGHPAALLATWFGAGLLPRAPGTWGSLAALPVGLLLAWAGGPWLLAAAAALLFAAGTWASGWYVARCGRDDPGEIVVDEAVGVWIALVPAGLDPIACLVAVIAFRVCDIAKVWPASWLDRRVKGGIGVMADDLVAAAYAAAVVAGVALLGK